MSAIASFEDVPVHAPASWRARVVEHLATQLHLLSLFARRAPDGDVLVTALLQGTAGDIVVERTHFGLGAGYQALSAEHPAAHIFERELHEQTGIPIEGHPWLKPVRFEGAAAGTQDTHVFHVVRGKEVHEVAVGPIHAGVIEPGAFRFMCHGETVHHLEIHLGYQHRGVEALLLKHDPRSLGPLVETIAGDTSVGHALAYSMAVETLAGHDGTAPELLHRRFLLELERIAVHLATLAGIAADIGLLQGAATLGRLRTTVINTSQRLCGSRFGRGAIRPGATLAALDGFAGTSRGPSLSLGELQANLSLVERDLQTLEDLLVSARTVRHRLQGVGMVTPQDAAALGLVGPVGRASGSLRDQRSYTPDSPRVTVATRDEGDCWARMLVRLDETHRSIQWLRAALEFAPHWTPTRAPVGELRPSCLTVSVVEGLRGEIVHALETDAEGRLVHYKVQDPSLRNWYGLALAVRKNDISDFPICNKSFDLSYCGSDL